ncbi:MAG: mannose-1-phosphate guanylyltransferase [Candidatus Hydrogenedentes bacterium]|nr:mannose-1-phosphate guanylyltransferase [Candidatus Hydrogenedentota bacterium]
MGGREQRYRVGVILAGGSGERFWPLSRHSRPKQLLRLTDGGQSMLEESVRRIAPVIPSERVLIVTSAHLVEAIRNAKIGVPDDNVIAEPCKRNTSGALAYATAHVLARFGNDVDWSLAVITADHVIGDRDRFCRTVETALQAAEQENALAILGIVPSRPETGYGYIQTEGQPLRLLPPAAGVAVYSVTAFHEKPNREKAQDFIAIGSYFWNSGMFFWKTSTFLQELEAVRPALAGATREMARALQEKNEKAVREIFETLEDISIDYALMEHAKRVVMARADFAWDDVGAWTALDRTYPHDPDGNVAVGHPFLFDSHQCIVYNEPGPDAMAVSVIGMDKIVVAVTRDGILVVPKDRVQDVRLAVQELRRQGRTQV